MEPEVFEQINIIADKPFNKVTEYKSHKKSKSKKRRKKSPISLAERLKRERMLKQNKKIMRKFDITKERDALIADMTKYQQYASGRSINLAMLKEMLTQDELTEDTSKTIDEINEVLNIFQNNNKELRTSIDICKRLDNTLETSVAMEAVMNLSGELVEIMESAESLEERASGIIAPYKDELRDYIIKKFGQIQSTTESADDILDVDGNAEEESSVSYDKEEINGDSEEKAENASGL